MTSSTTILSPIARAQAEKGSPVPSCAENTCVEDSLGLQHADRIEISRLLQAAVDSDAIGNQANVRAPLAVLNACPLIPGIQFGSFEEAAAAIELPWRSAMSAIHLLGHRVAKTAVSTDIDLHGVFHPLWRQTLTLSFASELVARVTRVAAPRSAWLAGLSVGLAGLNLAIRSAKSGAVVAAAPIQISVAGMDAVAKHFEVAQLLPAISVAAKSKQSDRSWNVAATAAHLLCRCVSGDWLLLPPGKLRSVKLSQVVLPTVQHRLLEVEKQTIETCNALWRCPMRATTDKPMA